MESKTVLLSQRDIVSLLTVGDVIKAVEDVLHTHSEGLVRLPAKVTLDLGEQGGWPHHNAYVNAMPAYLGQNEVAGIKWAGAFWDNGGLGLPSVMAMIILTDPEQGLPLAVMDGAWITALRTAAVSAIGAKYMAARPVQTVAIFGAGTQGRTHVLACDAVVQPERYQVYDANPAVADAYYETMQPKTQAQIRMCTSVQEAAQNADVVVTATSARKPFLQADLLKTGAYLCVIGSYAEIADDVVQWATRIVVDNREQTEHRGSLARFFASGQISSSDVVATLDEVVAGRVPGRTRTDENTLLVPIGMGSEDLAVAQLAYTRALERGIGQGFDFGNAEILV